MARMFDREQLLAAFDEIGLAAITANTRIDIAVFGGSALMLASNFRFSTEDVDIAEIVRPWPDWLSDVVRRIGKRNGWLEDRLNDAVSTFLSRNAQRQRDLIIWGNSAPMREYLAYASPAEFRSRDIFTEERPLRRARSGLAQR
jgi:hypothetical protein